MFNRSEIFHILTVQKMSRKNIHILSYYEIIYLRFVINKQ